MTDEFYCLVAVWSQMLEYLTNSWQHCLISGGADTLLDCPADLLIVTILIITDSDQRSVALADHLHHGLAAEGNGAGLGVRLGALLLLLRPELGHVGVVTCRHVPMNTSQLRLWPQNLSFLGLFILEQHTAPAISLCDTSAEMSRDLEIV